MHKITKTFFKEMKVPTPQMAARDIESWKTYNMHACIIDPEKIGLPLTKMMRNRKQESLLAFTLDSSNHILNVWQINEGNIDTTPVRPLEGFTPVFKDMAKSVIFAHNHPSGCSEPSECDWAVTRTLCAAGKILQIPVLDHIVVGKWTFCSMTRKRPEIFEQTCQNLT